MQTILDAYLWGYRNPEAAGHSFRKFREFYPDGNIFIQIDEGGCYDEYSLIASNYNTELATNPFKLGYPGNHQQHNIGRDSWPKECTLLWLDNLYNACLKSKSKFIIVLEEDTFILKPITILKEEFGIAVSEYTVSPIPYVFIDMVEQLNGNTNIPIGKCGRGYGAGGGFIIDREKWINSWNYFRPILELNYDMLVKQNKLIGWSDCVAQLVIMVGGYDVVMNKELVQPWFIERPDLYPNYTDWRNNEIVDYLKDINIIKNL
jgi:hypothetical protein